MLSNYKLVNIENGPVITIGTGLYVFNIAGAAYLDIKNPENPINVIGSMYLPQKYYEEITEDLAKYNEKLLNSYKLDGTIIGISYKGSRYSQLERYINRKPVEIIPDYNLKNETEIIANNKGLYQLINYIRNIKIAVKISIF